MSEADISIEYKKCLQMLINEIQPEHFFLREMFTKMIDETSCWNKNDLNKSKNRIVHKRPDLKL